MPALEHTATECAAPGPTAGFFLDGWASQPFLDRLGITRVGDLTDLDTIGIPVWFSCRPNSRGLSVSQGKGLTPEQARISAVMESAESAVAERTTPLISHRCSVDDAVDRGMNIVPLNNLQRCNPTVLRRDRVRAWVRGFCLLSGETVHAPYELVGMDMRSDSEWDHAAFSMSSIGLGAGRSEQQAILHALYELLENDATAFLQLFGIKAACRRPVSCANTGNDGLRSAIERVEKSGAELRFFDFTGAIRVPTIGCFLRSVMPESQESQVQLTAGFACRSDPGEAALAALLEAVQSRLTKIAGSREDLGEEAFRAGFEPLPPESQPEADIAAMSLEFPTAGGKATPEDMLESTVSASGAKELYVFPLTDENAGFHVVRVLVPKMESVVEEGVMRAGSHMLARLLQRRAAA